MNSMKLECGSCGAADMANVDTGLMVCSYCKSVTIIDQPESVVAATEAMLKTRKIVTIMKKGANLYYGPADTDGGHIHLTTREVVFVPHALNLRSGYKLVLPLDQIAQVNKHEKLFGLARFITIKMRDGEESNFVCWGRTALENAINRQIAELKR